METCRRLLPVLILLTNSVLIEQIFVSAVEELLELSTGNQDTRSNDVPSKRDGDAITTIQTEQLNGLTDEQRDYLLNKHNELRRLEGSSDMELMSWNDKLAEMGQEWCARCVFEHGQPDFDAEQLGSKDIGQNIYAWPLVGFTLENAMYGWYNETYDYDYDSNTCQPGRACGHYTAITWAQTNQVGCGMCYCADVSGTIDAEYVVCNFLPPGNYYDEKPFRKGDPCTQCYNRKLYCNDGLCDASCTAESDTCQCKAVCKRCGTKQDDCSCECSSGTYGPDCSDLCQDFDQQCNANPGLLPFMCDLPDFGKTKDKCPLMCEMCDAPTDATNACQE